MSATRADCNKLRLHIRGLLEGRDIGNIDRVEIQDTQGSTTLFVYARVNEGPVEMFEVFVRPVGQ